jgi:hypothetical protein
LRRMCGLLHIGARQAAPICGMMRPFSAQDVGSDGGAGRFTLSGVDLWKSLYTTPVEKSTGGR